VLEDDREAVRLLSAWRVALRDLATQADHLTAFGPAAVSNVRARDALLTELHEEVQRTFAAWREHGRAAPSAETLAVVHELRARQAPDPGD
jgi:hypothetical protein